MRKRTARDSSNRITKNLNGPFSVPADNLLSFEAWTDAEKIVREALAIREKLEPDAWATFNSKSMLGEALIGQKKYDDAEPLLLAGFSGMKERADKIPPDYRSERLTAAIDRLIRMYEVLEKKEEAAKWRKERERILKP